VSRSLGASFSKFRHFSEFLSRFSVAVPDLTFNFACAVSGRLYFSLRVNLNKAQVPPHLVTCVPTFFFWRGRACAVTIFPPHLIRSLRSLFSSLGFGNPKMSTFICRLAYLMRRPHEKWAVPHAHGISFSRDSFPFFNSFCEPVRTLW